MVKNCVTSLMDDLKLKTKNSFAFYSFDFFLKNDVINGRKIAINLCAQNVVYFSRDVNLTNNIPHLSSQYYNSVSNKS